MFLVVLLHPLLRKAFNAIFQSKKQISGPSNGNGPKSQHVLAETRLTQRVQFDLYFGLVMLCGLHGFSALKVLLILYTNFCLATRMPKIYVPAATWIFNIGILFANELGKGYPFASIASLISPWSEASTTKGSKNNWGSVLDSYGGLDPRWEILFNIKILRLISFNLDFCWSATRGGSSAIEVRKSDK